MHVVRASWQEIAFNASAGRPVLEWTGSSFALIEHAVIYTLHGQNAAPAHCSFSARANGQAASGLRLHQTSCRLLTLNWQRYSWLAWPPPQ